MVVLSQEEVGLSFVKRTAEDMAFGFCVANSLSRCVILDRV